MGDVRLKVRVKVVITNKKAALAFGEAIKRVRDMAEYQGWNTELREIFRLLRKARRGMEVANDANRHGGAGA